MALIQFINPEEEEKRKQAISIALQNLPSNPTKHLLEISRLAREGFCYFSIVTNSELLEKYMRLLAETQLFRFLLASSNTGNAQMEFQGVEYSFPCQEVQLPLEEWVEAVCVGFLVGYLPLPNLIRLYPRQVQGASPHILALGRFLWAYFTPDINHLKTIEKELEELQTWDCEYPWIGLTRDLFYLFQHFQGGDELALQDMADQCASHYDQIWDISKGIDHFGAARIQKPPIELAAFLKIPGMWGMEFRIPRQVRFVRSMIRKTWGE